MTKVKGGAPCGGPGVTDGQLGAAAVIRQQKVVQQRAASQAAEEKDVGPHGRDRVAAAPGEVLRAAGAAAAGFARRAPHARCLQTEPNRLYL